MNNQTGVDFRTTVGTSQGCPLPSVLFNNFLENIMQGTLCDHQTQRTTHF